MSEPPPNLGKGPGNEPPGPGQPHQNPYGGQQYPPYQNPYGGTPYGPPPDHPQATTVLVLGILGLVVCGILGIVAWVMGNRVVGEIDAAPGRYGGRSNANIGRILGMVTTGLMVAGLVFGVAVLAIVIGTA